MINVVFQFNGQSVFVLLIRVPCHDPPPRIIGKGDIACKCASGSDHRYHFVICFL